MREKWTQIIGYLKVYKDVEVGRYYFARYIPDPVEFIYLHGFSNAPESTYAACIYLKYITKTGGIGVKFVTAKSRIVTDRKEVYYSAYRVTS